MTSTADRITADRHKGRSIEVTGIVRMIKGKGLAIFAGELADSVDERTGQISQREVWVWLPLAKVARDCDPETITGKAETLTIPEWLAQMKGLV